MNQVSPTNEPRLVGMSRALGAPYVTGTGLPDTTANGVVVIYHGPPASSPTSAPSPAPAARVYDPCSDAWMKAPEKPADPRGSTPAERNLRKRLIKQKRKIQKKNRR